MRLFAAVLVAWHIALRRIVVLLLAAMLMAGAAAPEPQPQPIPRGLGVGIAWQRGDEVATDVLDKLKPPVWMNWVYDHMSDDRYLPMAYSANPAYSQSYIDAAVDMPGRTWLLLSEPECCGTQTDPAVAAAFTNRWQREVGGLWACCGTTTWAGWSEWMDGYVAAGGPEPPLCHWHIFSDFATPEVGFIQGWLDANDWDCELIISEAADPWGTVADNKRMMSDLARLVANGKVRAAIWYSADPDGDYHGLWLETGLLADGGETITPLGLHWLSLQPGGANDPAATPTPEPTAVPEPASRSALWLPWGFGLAE